MRLPRYSGKDNAIMLWTLIPFAVVLNSLIFGTRFFSGWYFFLVTLLISLLILSLSFVLYGAIAVILRNRFPSDEVFFKRTLGMLGIFMLMTGLIILLLLKIFESIGSLHYAMSDRSFTRAYIATVVLNIFLTVLQEGVSKFQSYRDTLIETEQLKKEYMQSQLLGLKSQVNPHFLFNSLNSLSSLINENPENAESFLNHLSKVYRYLLRNNDEHFVAVQEEVQFINSYYHILKARYGEGVKVETAIREEHRNMLIPPLTLQILFDNTLNRNAISKSRPLSIVISSQDSNWLCIKSNVQLRIGLENGANDAGMENIINKYRLLCRKNVLVHENDQYRVIRLPLLHQQNLHEA
ncbi:MAG: histidine kinase [Chitinophagaceae bacterium]